MPYVSSPPPAHHKTAAKMLPGFGTHGNPEPPPAVRWQEVEKGFIRQMAK
jgi:hypothetical protein